MRGFGLFVKLGDFLYYHLSALYTEGEKTLSHAENELLLIKDMKYECAVIWYWLTYMCT